MHKQNKTAYLCLDIGTHAVKAAVISPQGILKCITIPINLIYKQVSGKTHIEQNPDHIIEALVEAVQSLGSHLNEVESAAIACQRSTVMAWNKKTGQALSPAISWQDRRGLEKIENLGTEQKQQITKITGLPLSAHYGASKLELLYDNYKHSENFGAGPLISWLIYQIQSPSDKSWLCDESNALRTQLWDWKNAHWSHDLCQLFNCASKQLPQVKPVISSYGLLDKTKLKLLGEIKIQAACGDQNSAYYGVVKSILTGDLLSPALSKNNKDKKSKLDHQHNQALINIGTGAFILCHSGEYHRRDLNNAASSHDINEPKELINSLIYSDNTKVSTCYEGGVNGAGSALSYYLKHYSSFSSESELFSSLESYYLSDKKNKLTSQSPLLFFNCIGGLGAPWWQAHLAESKSCFYDLSLTPVDESKFSKKDQVLAVIDSIVFMLYAIIEKLPQQKQLIMTGGLAKIKRLSHQLSQLSQLPILVPEEHQLTLLGTACLASQKQYKPQLTGQWVYPQQKIQAEFKQRNHCYHKLYKKILSEQTNDKNSRP